jgi:magnesium transporter
MLKFHSTNIKGELQVALSAEALPPEVNWIDAMRPTKLEAAWLEKMLGIVVPSKEALSQIETSSRLRRDNSHLFLSMPVVVKLTSGLAQTSPIGFLLGKDYLLTVRYKPMKPCDDLHYKLNYTDVVDDGLPPNGPSALIAVLESIVEHSSDGLEMIDADLDFNSKTIFDQGTGRGGEDPIRDSVAMRNVLGAISGNGYMTAKIGEELLWISRILPFVSREGASYISPEQHARIDSLTRDVNSLMDYGKVQADRNHFLLDATLGLTNVEQNNIFRLLTVVSVVGIPPTLVASMYGMNFKYMPELEWPYGYAWGLGLILISALIPAAWFKKRGWW